MSTNITYKGDILTPDGYPDISNTEVHKHYVGIAKQMHLAYYIYAAERLGVEYEMLNPGIAMFKHNGRVWSIWNAATDLSPIIAKYFSVNKNRSTQIMQKAGIPVAKQADLLSKEDAVRFYEEVHSIVIKPVNGVSGKGITLLPHNKQEVEDAFVLADSKCTRRKDGTVNAVAEEFIHGEHYRLLVIGDKTIAAVRRSPATVVGDGKSTIQELIDQTNAKRKERKMMNIKTDSGTTLKLEHDGRSLNSVPSDGEKVILRYNANASTGGTTEECMADVDPYYLDLAVRATHSLGLRFGGVDLIAEDVTDPNAKHVINEINHFPGMRVHYKVDKGESVDVATMIIEYMMEVAQV